MRKGWRGIEFATSIHFAAWRDSWAIRNFAVNVICALWRPSNLVCRLRPCRNIYNIPSVWSLWWQQQHNMRLNFPLSLLFFFRSWTWSAKSARTTIRRWTARAASSAAWRARRASTATSLATIPTRNRASWPRETRRSSPRKPDTISWQDQVRRSHVYHTKNINRKAEEKARYAYLWFPTYF